MTGFAIPSPQAPITETDGRTISPVWWRYLRDVQALIGGPSDPFQDMALLSGGSGGESSGGGHVWPPFSDAPGHLTAGAGLTGGGNMGANVTIALASAAPVAGTYTPTLTNVANLDASTAYTCQYLQVGSVVTVSGRVDVDPTAPAASTQLGISLPVASNFAASNQCAGTAFASGIAGQGAAILGDTTNDRAQLQYISADLTNQGMFFSFSYVVI